MVRPRRQRDGRATADVRNGTIPFVRKVMERLKRAANCRLFPAVRPRIVGARMPRMCRFRM
jgi:hypothetical protein